MFFYLTFYLNVIEIFAEISNLSISCGARLLSLQYPSLVGWSSATVLEFT